MRTGRPLSAPRSSQSPLTSSGTKRGLFTRQDFIYDAEHDHYTCPAGAKLTKIHRRADHTEDFDRYRHLSACFTCPLRSRCTPTQRRIIKRWEHEAVIEAMQQRLEEMPDAICARRSIVEHVFGTIKDWMGRSHFRTRRLANVGTEMSLHVLAYNLKRAIAVRGTPALIAAMRG
jgi:hypothetical protein